ncbi:glycosyltransferase family 4 protein [Psychroserpens luteolus]|uniref:glycosyltransferase family 4 protein n=1 Tax=Psychroserpens luteolus TaxID=2855840 RepID=UPI001E30C1B8|nr:glycosyltransferase family 4 protein [Psychroserpens luteolus]MCD2259156.1 glycosyltransferase family 4 protein [Psychroserpens luteolus]
MSYRPKILIIGDAYIPTGYARVIRSIFEPLAQKYELWQLAIRYNGEPHDYPWQLIQANKLGDPYGFDQLGPIAKSMNSEIIFILYDINFQGKYLEILKSHNLKSKIVCYSPVESGPIPIELLKTINRFDHYTVFTEFAKNEINKTLKEYRLENGSFKFPKVQVIPHGIDTNTFYPLADKKIEGKTVSGKNLARQRIGLTDEAQNNSFIVLNANRNMFKKRLDITIQGFAKFAHNKPKNVKLYLHTAMQYTGWNIALLAKRFNIEDRIILTTDQNKHPEVTSEYLNLIYNACDVGINTSTNEGWGLVSFEHAATMSPQLIPNHTCLSNLWENSALMLSSKYTMINTSDHCDSYIITADEVANALEHIYNDTSLRKRITINGYKNATKKEYHWSVISKSWDQLFRTLIKESI